MTLQDVIVGFGFVKEPKVEKDYQRCFVFSFSFALQIDLTW